MKWCSRQRWEDLIWGCVWWLWGLEGKLLNLMGWHQAGDGNAVQWITCQQIKHCVIPLESGLCFFLEIHLLIYLFPGSGYSLSKTNHAEFLTVSLGFSTARCLHNRCSLVPSLWASVGRVTRACWYCNTASLFWFEAKESANIKRFQH